MRYMLQKSIQLFYFWHCLYQFPNQSYKMNNIKSSIKFSNAYSSDQPEFERVRVLNDIKIRINGPLDTLRPQKQRLPTDMMNLEESIQQMTPRKLEQTSYIPVLAKKGFQELKISDCITSQQPFQELKKSQIASEATNVSNRSIFSFANDTNRTFNESIEVSFCCMHNVENNSSSCDHPKPEKQKREKESYIIRSEKQVLSEQNVFEAISNVQTQSSQKQTENSPKKVRKVFDFNQIAGKLKLSPQYQSIQAIRKGKEETQKYQAGLQRRKINEQSRIFITNNTNQSSSAQQQLFVSPILPAKNLIGKIKDKMIKSDSQNITKSISRLTIGEKYGVTNKKMFDVIQEEIDHDIKEASIDQKDISEVLKLMQITQITSSQPSDSDLIKSLNMRNLIRDYIKLLNEPNQFSQKKLLY